MRYLKSIYLVAQWITDQHRLVRKIQCECFVIVVMIFGGYNFACRLAQTSAAARYVLHVCSILQADQLKFWSVMTIVSDFPCMLNYAQCQAHCQLTIC